MSDPRELFLSQEAFAVAGASTSRSKYGNKVLRAYLQNKKTVFPINAKSDLVEGQKAYESVAVLPRSDIGLSIVTPPQITEKVVREALDKGVKHFWMQPGAESLRAVEAAEAAGANVIADGSCVLVELGYRESE